jgi:hypothetical protein
MGNALGYPSSRTYGLPKSYYPGTEKVRRTKPTKSERKEMQHKIFIERIIEQFYSPDGEAEK